MMHAALQFALIIPYFTGITTNGFALAVNLWIWIFGGDLNVSDFYICCIALSNISLQLWLGFTWLCDDGWIYGTFCQINYVLMIISTHYTIVVATCMCLFFCSKIVVFNHWLLQMYSRQYTESHKRVIFQFLIVSVVLVSPLFWILKHQEPFTSSNSSFTTISTFSNLYDMEVERNFELYKMYILTIGYVVPSLLSLVGASCIMGSLAKHMKRMRGTMEKKHGVLTEAHRRAAITVLLLLGLNLIHVVTSVIILLSVYPEQDVRSILCKVVSSLYTPIQGILLIRRNSKLSSVASEITRKISGALKLHSSKKENTSAHII